MRNIKFRGKRAGNIWVYGDLVHIDKGYIIITSTNLTIDNSLSEDNALVYSEKEFSVVIPETVSQFTGLTDKNGKDIYEGDICSANWTWANCCQVIFCKKRSGFYFKPINDIGNKAGSDKYYRMNSLKVEIIGNIHDNYELLNKE